MRKALAAILFLFSSHCWSDDLAGAKTRERVQPHALSAEVSYLLRTRIGVAEKGFGVFYHHRCHLHSRSVECKGEHLPILQSTCPAQTHSPTCLGQGFVAGGLPIVRSLSRSLKPRSPSMLRNGSSLAGTRSWPSFLLLSRASRQSKSFYWRPCSSQAGSCFIFPIVFPNQALREMPVTYALDVHLRRPKVPGEQLPHTLPCACVPRNLSEACWCRSAHGRGGRKWPTHRPQMKGAEPRLLLSGKSLSKFKPRLLGVLLERFLTGTRRCQRCLGHRHAVLYCRGAFPRGGGAHPQFRVGSRPPGLCSMAKGAMAKACRGP